MELSDTLALFLAQLPVDPLVALPGFGALGAAVYVFVRVIKSDNTYDGIINSLKDELRRKDERIEELEMRIEEVSDRLTELEFFEYVELGLRLHITALETYIAARRITGTISPPTLSIPDHEERMRNRKRRHLKTKTTKSAVPPPPPNPKDRSQTD